jgi:hypothetical protein
MSTANYRIATDESLRPERRFSAFPASADPEIVITDLARVEFDRLAGNSLCCALAAPPFSRYSPLGRCPIYSLPLTEGNREVICRSLLTDMPTLRDSMPHAWSSSAGVAT